MEHLCYNTLEISKSKSYDIDNMALFSPISTLWRALC